MREEVIFEFKTSIISSLRGVKGREWELGREGGMRKGENGIGGWKGVDEKRGSAETGEGEIGSGEGREENERR